jgi:hypothetical protein
MHQVVDASNMPWMKPSSEARGDFGVSMKFLSSLVKIVVSPYILVHLLQQLFMGMGWFFCKILSCWSWPEPHDHGFDDDVIRDC